MAAHVDGVVTVVEVEVVDTVVAVVDEGEILDDDDDVVDEVVVLVVVVEHSPVEYPMLLQVARQSLK